MKLFAGLLALALSAGAASAASFDLLRPTGQEASVSAAFAFRAPDPADPNVELLFVEDFGGFSLIVDDAGAAGDVIFDDLDPATPNSLTGDLSHARVLDGMAELLFEVTANDAFWGPLVRATINEPSLSASNGFFQLDGFEVSVALESVEVVPLPATLPLLVGGFALAGAFMRRRH